MNFPIPQQKQIDFVSEEHHRLQQNWVSSKHAQVTVNITVIVTLSALISFAKGIHHPDLAWSSEMISVVKMARIMSQT